MSKNSSLKSRMLGYEQVSKGTLTKRVPVVIRIDGKAFHTFTKGMKKPFDDIIEKSMLETMKYLCENIQNCVIGYTQSDEISLVLCDYESIDTSSWFDNEIQKLCSVAASMATFKFNAEFSDHVFELRLENTKLWLENDNQTSRTDSITNNEKLYMKKAASGALFDARVFNVPIDDVHNYLVYRQQDATRNSIQSLAQSLYGHSEIKGISTNELQDKMFTEKGINWNELTTYQKRGLCCIKVPRTIEKNGSTVTRNKWEIDYNTPIFTQDNDYINNRIHF